jgi:hypothetical protein
MAQIKAPIPVTALKAQCFVLPDKELRELEVDPAFDHLELQVEDYVKTHLGLKLDTGMLLLSQRERKLTLHARHRRSNLPRLQQCFRLPARRPLPQAPHQALQPQLPPALAGALLGPLPHRLQALAARPLQERRRLRLSARVQPAQDARVLALFPVWLLRRGRRVHVPACRAEGAPAGVQGLYEGLLSRRCVPSASL